MLLNRSKIQTVLYITEHVQEIILVHFLGKKKKKGLENKKLCKNYYSFAINNKYIWLLKHRQDKINKDKHWLKLTLNRSVREHVLGLSHTVDIECVIVMICLIIWWGDESWSVRSHSVWLRVLHSLILTNLLLWVI